MRYVERGGGGGDKLHLLSKKDMFEMRSVEKMKISRVIRGFVLNMTLHSDVVYEFIAHL